MSAVGIDFGSQSAVISVVRGGGIEVISNEYNYRLTPCIVSLGDKQRFLGEAARSQAISNFKNTISYFKRLLGLKYDDPLAKEELKYLFVTHSKLPDGGIGFHLRYKGEEMVFSAEEVTGMFLTKLKHIVEHELKRSVVDVCLSCPTWFNDEQRRALARSAQIAGLNPLRIFNDLTAVGLAYGIYKQDLPETEPRYIAIVDMGDASFQVSVCAFTKKKLTVLASVSDPCLGGRNFDDIIVENFRAKFLEQTKIDIMGKPRALIRMRTECEKLKKLMSANVQPIPINIECITDDHDFRSSMSRSELEEKCDSLLARIEATCTKAIVESKLDVLSFESVEIIGGGTRIPCVRNKISEVFCKEVRTTLNADEAVSRGCALQAAVLTPALRVREYQISDSTPYNIELVWTAADGQEENRAIVIEKNSNIPATKLLTFNRSSPFVLSAEYKEPELVPGHQKQIGMWRVDNVVPNSEGGNSKIKVRVRMNPNGVFAVQEAHSIEVTKVEEVEMEDAKPADNTTASPPTEKTADDSMETDQKEKEKKVTQHTKKIDLPIVCLSANESVINEREREAQMELNDKTEMERVDSKNAVEEYVYEMRDKLSGAYEPFINESDKATFSSLLQSTEDWLYEEGEEEVKSAYVEKLNSLKTLGEPVQKRAREAEERPRVIESLRRSIVSYRKVADMYDEKHESYSHLTESEVETIRSQCEAKDMWINDRASEQASKPSYEDPVVTVSQIEAFRSDLERICGPIKAKPKPKVATPAPSSPAPEAEKDNEKEANGSDAPPNMEVD